MTHHRQTKIVATLGPASSDKAMIKTLLEAGVNVFRLNFSHGKPEDHVAKLEIIRALEAELKRPVAILADMQGPKLRIGTFKEGSVTLSEGQNFRFDLDPAPGDETRVNLPHPEVLSVLEEGGRIFLDDGKVRAKITKKGKDFAEAVILSGAKLSDKKGLNVPGTLIPIPALTDKDKADIAAALEMGVDWIAQSFVQTPEDVKEARALINGRASLLVKIEKPAALGHIDEIIALADGVMLARGDLGVEIPPEDVPSVQKRIVRKVRESGKPIIVATQMLESMITNARPTRAEASDVATAVYDGADAVMLSAETATGDYPARAVEIMARICLRTEEDETYHDMMEVYHPETLGDPSDAITTAAYYVAEDVEASLIVTYTVSGSTALRMARQRPHVPILCLTPHESVARRLSLSYGVRAVVTEEHESDFTGPAHHAAQIALQTGLAEKGQRFVMTAGVPFGEPGSTNILRIADVE
ncbi:MAG: pyruvate kinase [Alphaproteobacteria bacterium]|nr:pyruvate kinase [Alphaproteobacteria bacterium]